MTTAVQTIPHGTVSGRKHYKCGCRPCLDAAADYERNRRRNVVYGRWHPTVDAEPVRQHVRSLMAAGLGHQRIATLAGVGSSVVRHLLYPAQGRTTTQQIHAERAAKILAVTAKPALRARGALQDATGTRRRLRALVAAGWPQRRLAVHLGTYERKVSFLIHAKLVQRCTAETVTQLYTDLVNLDPAEHGVTAKQKRAAQQRAHDLGYLPASFWDRDIDDPAADPFVDDSGELDDEAVQRVVDGGTAVLTRAERVEAARILHEERGVPLTEAGPRLGVTDRTVLRWKQAGWAAG